MNVGFPLLEASHFSHYIGTAIGSLHIPYWEGRFSKRKLNLSYRKTVLSSLQISLGR